MYVQLFNSVRKAKGSGKNVENQHLRYTLMFIYKMCTVCIQSTMYTDIIKKEYQISIIIMWAWDSFKTMTVWHFAINLMIKFIFFHGVLKPTKIPRNNTFNCVSFVCLFRSLTVSCLAHIRLRRASTLMRYLMDLWPKQKSQFWYQTKNKINNDTNGNRLPAVAKDWRTKHTKRPICKHDCCYWIQYFLCVVRTTINEKTQISSCNCKLHAKSFDKTVESGRLIQKRQWKKEKKSDTRVSFKPNLIHHFPMYSYWFFCLFVWESCNLNIQLNSGVQCEPIVVWHIPIRRQ